MQGVLQRAQNVIFSERIMDSGSDRVYSSQSSRPATENNKS